MGKLEELLKSRGGNAAESMGVGVTRSSTPAGGGGPSVPARLQGVKRAGNVSEIPVDKIDRDPNQPREDFDEDALHRLAESIKSKGQLQPIRVRWDEALGVYRVVVGERRWRAARMAGIATLTAVVVEGEMSDDELLEVQLVENALREDLNPVEQAKAYKRLLENTACSIRQLAARMAVPHAQIVKSLALLDLPTSVQAHVETGNLNPSTAYELSRAEDPEAAEAIAEEAVTQRLTGAQVKEKVASASKNPKPRPTRLDWRTRKGSVVQITMPPGLDPALAAAELREVLKQIASKASGAEAA